MGAVGGRSTSERGAAVVEFAIMLPLFLLVIGGVVDFGRAFFTQIQLTNAAREGARAAIVSTAPPADIQARAGVAGVPGMTTTINSACPGANASVTTQVSFQWIVLEPALNLFSGAGVLPNPLSSTAVMKCGG
jgi:Flp pilus assembly protein TadG